MVLPVDEECYDHRDNQAHDHRYDDAHVQSDVIRTGGHWGREGGERERGGLEKKRKMVFRNLAS